MTEADRFMEMLSYWDGYWEGRYPDIQVIASCEVAGIAPVSKEIASYHP